MSNPYRAVLATPGALAFSGSGFLARLPMSTVTLGIVILVADRTGSYGYAALISAVYTVASGVSAPVLGRLTDRLGQGAVLFPSVLVFSSGLAVLVLAVEVGWPTPVPHILAAIAGLSYPPVDACVRSRWSHALEQGAALHTAYSFEAVVDEAIFMLGPVAVTLLATRVHESAGLLTILVVSGIGGLWLASQRSTEPPVTRGVAAADREPLGWTWLVPLMFGAAFLGSLFGSTEVATVAFAAEDGHAGLTGLLLACWAFGSLLAGVVTGLITWKSGPLRRYQAGAIGMAMAALPMPFVDSLAVMFGVLFLAGFAISPTMVASMSLVEANIPTARLNEGITWVVTGLSCGIAPGAALAGQLVDAYGASAAYYVSLVSGLLAAAAALSTKERSRSVKLAAQPSRNEV